MTTYGIASLSQQQPFLTHVIRTGLLQHHNLSPNQLVSAAYGKLGAIQEACLMDEPDVASWIAMIKEGHHKEACQLFQRMQQEGMKPDTESYISILKTCSKLGSLKDGKLIHACIIEKGLASDELLQAALLNMYATCGDIHEARSVFEKIYEPSVVSWTSMISAYARKGYGLDALELFEQMQQEGVKPNKVTFITILSVCANLLDVVQGEMVHALIIDHGLEADVIVGNALVSMYGKCNAVHDARSAFDKLNGRNVVTWTAMITAYSRKGMSKEALELFWQMQLGGVKPDTVTFISILSACAGLPDQSEGKVVHALAVEGGFTSDVVVGNAIINMYGKLGFLEEASFMFNNMHQRDVASWNTMLTAYIQQGLANPALQLLCQMQQEGVEPDVVTFVSILSACASLAVLEEGNVVHTSIVNSGFQSSVTLGNALMYMYVKCGSMDQARCVFNKLHQHDLASWNIALAAYSQGSSMDALKLFKHMRQEGIRADEITFTNLLCACSSLVAVAEGRLIHTHIVNEGFESDVVIGNALVNMYGKCGALQEACVAFDKVQQHNVISWTAVITAYVLQGLVQDAFQLIQQMEHEGVKPNEVTFLSLLSACSHGGLVDEGYYYFNSMIRDHDIAPTVEHYTCMIDLLGRAGHLDEADKIIHKMPVQADVFAWSALLGACRVHGDVKRGKHAAVQIMHLDPQKATPFVSLSNLFAAEAWDADKRLGQFLIDTGVNIEL